MPKVLTPAAGDQQRRGMSSLDDETRGPTYPWLLVGCLVGLDYFSSLAYLPSIAVTAAGCIAPLAAVFVALVTLCLALPVYYYLAGRAPPGRGAAGLIEQVVPGWRGKIVVLTLLGFAAADFVLTRSVSLADAATHLIHNPHGAVLVGRVAASVETLRPWFGEAALSYLERYFTRQVATSMLLSLLTFGFWSLLQRGFTRKIVILSAIVVSLYLTLNVVVIGSGLVYLLRHPEALQTWWQQVAQFGSAEPMAPRSFAGAVAIGILVVWSFPQLALGLSGFELTLTVAPLVKGSAADDPTALSAGRSPLANLRRLMFAAVAMMSVFLPSAVLVSTVLIPAPAFLPNGAAHGRALAYLAGGGALADGAPASAINACFGEAFGNLYDLSTIVILSLAGASIISSLRGLLPHYLHRLGMELPWAGKTGSVMYILNCVILLTTFVFHASVTAQQWAYSTSVLALLAGAALAAVFDVRQHRHVVPSRRFATVPFAMACVFALAMTALVTWINHSGLVIALAFVAAILTTSFTSRWIRSTELRFEGFSFADDATSQRWLEIRTRTFQVIAPHRPGQISLAEKNRRLHRDFRLSMETPVLFVLVAVGDPSDFYQKPLMHFEEVDGLEVMHISRSTSVAHVLAALCLELCHPGGRPPEMLFGWSHERPLAANLNFLLLGEGNIPWMVKELVRRAVPDPRCQPRITIG